VKIVNSQMPKLDLKSSAKPSLYAYPAPLEEKKREEREKVTTAVLSIAARQRRRDHDRKHRDEKMEVDEDKEEKKTTTEEKKTEDDKKKTDEKKAADKKDEKEEKKKEPEPNFEVLNNPARVMRQQLKVVTLNDNSQYVPLKDVSIGGIVMVRNLKPGEEELVEAVAGECECFLPNFFVGNRAVCFSFRSEGRRRERTGATRTVRMAGGLGLVRPCLRYIPIIDVIS
jgi:26S proteasome regulatory subunit N2